MNGENKYLTPEEIIKLSQNGTHPVYCKYTHRIYSYDPINKVVTYQNLDVWRTDRIGN